MDEALTLLGDLADRLLGDVEDRAAAARLAVVAQSAGTDGVAALLSLARLIGEAAEVEAMTVALASATADEVLTRVALFVVACFAAVRADYPTRQDAVAARIYIAATADALYPLAAPAGPDAVDFVVRLAGSVVTGLSALATSRAPLVRVEINMSAPSALMAWQMYADPARGAEIVRRNRVATPMLMPAAFEAPAT